MEILIGVLCVIVCCLIVVTILYRRLRTSHTRAKELHEKELQSRAAALTSVTRELEEIRQKNKEEQFARQLMSSLDECIVYINEKGIVNYINHYASQFFSPEFSIGMHYTKGIHLMIHGKANTSLFESAFGGVRTPIPDGTVLSSQKGDIAVSGSLIPVSTSENSFGVILILTDISERVHKENDQKVFFSQAAHELRTPLTVIRLTVGVLMKKFMTLPPEKIAEHLRRMDETSAHLVALVNDLLNMSRLDMGRIQLVTTSFDMVSLTDEIIAELMPLFREKKLYIHHEMGDIDSRNVIGDRTKAKEVLTNIISNSVKYTIIGGLTITHTMHQNMFATKVIDTGSGIPIEQQSMLFSRFMQTGSGREQSSAKSTGLGLYISKQFAQLMRGDIVLEKSEPAVGSTFTFTLPIG